VRKHSYLNLFDLLFGLFSRDLLGVIDQQADDFRIVDVALLKLLGKLVVRDAAFVSVFRIARTWVLVMDLLSSGEWKAIHCLTSCSSQRTAP
jgi:hypothetical protein